MSPRLVVLLLALLLGGMAVYTLAAVGNTLAPNVDWLIVTRAVQGAAMGAAVMSARAIVRDLYRPEQGARVMATALGGLGVIACLSPLFGGLVTPLVGWRWALATLVLYGALLLALLLMRFAETRAEPVALRPSTLLRNWGRILRHPGFIAWAGLFSASYGALFTFLAGSSFVFLEVYRVSRPVYGLAAASSALAYILGTLACRRIVPRVGLRCAVHAAGFLSLGGGTLMGVLAWAGVHSPWAFMLPMYLFMFGHGIHQPCAQIGVVAPFPRIAGAASAMSGFILTLVGFGVGAWLGVRLDGSVFPMINGIWFWTAVIAFFAWVPVQRHGDLAAPSAAREAQV